MKFQLTTLLLTATAVAGKNARGHGANAAKPPKRQLMGMPTPATSTEPAPAPVTDQGVITNGYPLTKDGNNNCQAFDFDFGWKIDGGCKDMDEGSPFYSMDEATGKNTCAGDVTGTVEVSCGADGIEATITPSDNVYVIMKSSTVSKIYELEGGKEATLDCGATNKNGKRQAISHIEFCFDCPGAPAPEAGGSPDTGASDPAPEPAPATPSGPDSGPESGPAPESGPEPDDSGPEPDDSGPATEPVLEPFTKSNNGGGQAGSAHETCDATPKIGPGNSDKYRCCAGSFNDGKYFGECETSSCVQNMDAKNLLCHNYGSPQHPVSDNLSDTKKGGSNNCPYTQADRAICDTSEFTALNDGNNCRDEKGNNHCLGRVKCMTDGVDVPKNGHSDGTALPKEGGVCGSESHPAGTICFYMGASENFKVCGGEGSDDGEIVCKAKGNSGKFTMEELEAGSSTTGYFTPGEEVTIKGVKYVLTSSCDADPIAEEPIRETDPETDPEPAPESTPATDPEPEPATDPEPEPPVDEIPTPRTPIDNPSSASGDPHFKTWNGAKFDYHGECDLVLVDNPTFADGAGLRVHIRTTRVKYFSFIEKVAVMIGSDVLEFSNDVENFSLNGRIVEGKKRHHKTRLGGYLVRRDPKALSIRLSEGLEAREARPNGAKVDLHMRRNGFPAVIVDGADTELFKGSLGLLGDWETGKKLARDGKTELTDATTFALEWQVRDTEPMLFSEARFPQFPSVCTPPEKMPQRLGMSSFEQSAEKACAHWKEDKEDCIFDVIATRDVLIAEEGHIVHVE